MLGHLDGRIERADCASGRVEAVAPSPIGRIVREAALLNPDQTLVKGSLSPPLPDADREALRAADPGPPLHTGGFRTIRSPRAKAVFRRACST